MSIVSGIESATAAPLLAEAVFSNNVAPSATPSPARHTTFSANLLTTQCRRTHRDLVTGLRRWTETAKETDLRVADKRRLPDAHFRQLLAGVAQPTPIEPDEVQSAALERWSFKRHYKLTDGLEALGRICKPGKHTAVFLGELYELSLDVTLTPEEKDTILLVGSIVDAISSVVPKVGIMKIVGVSARVTAKILKREPLTTDEMLDIAVVAKNYSIRKTGKGLSYKTATIVTSDIGLAVGRYAWKRAHVDLSLSYLDAKETEPQSDDAFDQSTETTSTQFYVMAGDIPLIQDQNDAGSIRWRLPPLEWYEAAYRPAFLSWPIYTLFPLPLKYERAKWPRGMQTLASRGPLYRDDGDDNQQFYIEIDDSWYAVRHGLSDPSYVFDPTDSTLPGLPVENAAGVWRFKPLCYTPVTDVSAWPEKNGVNKANGKRYIALIGDIVEVGPGGVLDDRHKVATAPLVAGASWLCSAHPSPTTMTPAEQEATSPATQESTRPVAFTAASSRATVAEERATRGLETSTPAPLPIKRPTKKRSRVPKLPFWGLG